MSEDREREEFERFMKGRMFLKWDFLKRNNSGHYKEYSMQAYWEVWMARAMLKDQP